MAKRLLTWSLVGAAIGNVLGVLAGIPLLSYWFKPPGVTDQDRCVVQIDAALVDLGKFQAATAAAGLVLFLIFGILWVRGHRRPAAPGPEAPKSTTPSV